MKKKKKKKQGKKKDIKPPVAAKRVNLKFYDAKGLQAKEVHFLYKVYCANIGVTMQQDLYAYILSKVKAS